MKVLSIFIYCGQKRHHFIDSLLICVDVVFVISAAASSTNNKLAVSSHDQNWVNFDWPAFTTMRIDIISSSGTCCVHTTVQLFDRYFWYRCIVCSDSDWQQFSRHLFCKWFANSDWGSWVWGAICGTVWTIWESKDSQAYGGTLGLPLMKSGPRMMYVVMHELLKSFALHFSTRLYTESVLRSTSSAVS